MDPNLDQAQITHFWTGVSACDNITIETSNLHQLNHLKSEKPTQVVSTVVMLIK